MLLKTTLHNPTLPIPWLLSSVASIFYNQLSAAGTPELEDLAEKIGPLNANFASDLSLDPVLFARIKAVHDERAKLKLSVEENTLLEETYKGFVRNGAMLDDAGKKRIRTIDEQLSVLSPQFQKNLKNSTESFQLILDAQDDLAGLPPSAVTAAAETAIEKGQAGKWMFTLHAPSYVPFITYSSRRDLREKIWMAFGSRASSGDHDNTTTVLEMVKLKRERARLLGFHSHAAYVLAERMAGTPERVKTFLDDMLGAYRPAALQDLEALKVFAAKDGITELKPWDVAYYGEKLREQKFNFNTEDLRPYFPLKTVLDGTFTHFSKLFGVRFEPNASLPVWHKDVMAYDVINEKDGAYVGSLYADFYPRTGKQSGAWMTTYRDQGLQFGKINRPLVAIVCNFTKPTADQPSLLTHDEVTTLFHEMGHAMHMMLSDCTYTSLAGTNVKWDFVELPSQLQENWCYEPETLGLISEHIDRRGETMPADLIQKLNNAKTFMAGWAGLRQMSFSLLDLTWYMIDPATITSIPAFEDSVLDKITLFPRLAGPVSTSFGHIFGGGYSAGYYSYKWAEVLDADAFDAFRENGLYDPETARAYRSHILSRGGSEDPNVLYARFRGRAATPEALLRREGLSTGKVA
jgi:peptidyl-dipeptidase Dcp